MAMGNYEGTARRILSTYRTWAVVGLSPRPTRASHGVAAFLQQRGFRIIPINPGADEILGEVAYPDLASVPVPIDVVDIFRRSDQAGRHVDEAIACLLYTSDAADDLTRVDLGGRRI